MTSAQQVEKISVLDFIKSLPFFDEFSEEEKSALVNKKGLFEKYTEGEVIIKQGAIEPWLFIILLGKVRLTKSLSENVEEGRISLKNSIDITLATT